MKPNKKFLTLGLMILAVALITFFTLKMRPLMFIHVSDVEEVFIYKNIVDPREGFYVNEKKDISFILKKLKSMNLDRHKDIELEDVNYTIYINLKKGDNISIGILPDKMIIIGSKFYTTDKDYNNDFNEIIYELSRKYNNIIN